MNNYIPQPGYYNSYGYMNPAPTMSNPTQFSQPQYPQSYAQSYSMNQSIPTQQPSVLNGKFVDNEEILKVTEIPMGGYGIFPKADFSAIYFKYWTKEGKTDVMKFVPVQVDTPQSEHEIATQRIIDKIESLETKLGSFFAQGTTPQSPQKIEPQLSQQQQQQSPQFEMKEVKMNEY